MRTIPHKKFTRMLHSLARGNSVAKLVHQKVVGAIEQWEHGENARLTKTKHGERRIKNCVKYELPNGYRLITVEKGSNRILLFVGTHDSSDLWLENHRGLEPSVSKRGRIDLIAISDEISDAKSVKDDRLLAFDTETRTVLKAIPSEALSYLDLPKTVQVGLKLISINNLTEEDELWDHIFDLKYSSDEQACATLDVIRHVGNGEVEEAVTRAQLFAEEATTSSSAIDQAIDQGTSTDTVISIKPEQMEELKKIVESHSYSDWLLYLNPAQKKHVIASHSGPARVLGVSGSGKTCVAVHRAKEMALRYPGEKVLILVLNASLKSLIKRLLDELCPDKLRGQIQVQRIYDYCQKVIDKYGDPEKARAQDQKTGETVEICWDQFTNRPQRKRYYKLINELGRQDVDPWGYLFDELIWIRSGIGQSLDERIAYLTMPREGRGKKISFPTEDPKDLKQMWSWVKAARTRTGFVEKTRSDILSMLKEYEDYMDAGGLLDDDGVALTAHSLLSHIESDSELRSRCVIIDECQDFSTIQLAVAATIPTDKKDGLLLVGDPVQKVFPKQQNLLKAGIDVRGRSTIFRKNYRNTREILEAAYPVVNRYQKSSGINEQDILEPEYATRNGRRPSLIKCSNTAEQKEVLHKLIEQMRTMPDPAICIGFPSATEQMNRGHYRAVSGKYVVKVSDDRWSKGSVLKNRLLPSEMSPMDLESFGDTVHDLKGRVTVAEFNDMKGFEFSTVILVNLDDEHLFPNWIPEDEHWRVAFQSYVAMTRARDNLYLLTAGEESTILNASEEFLETITGEEFLRDFQNADADSESDAIENENEATDSTGGDHFEKEGEEEVDSEDVDLPFDATVTSTIELIVRAQDNKDNYDIFDRIMQLVNERVSDMREYEIYAAEVEELRKHWRILMKQNRPSNHLADDVANEPQWPTMAKVNQANALSGKIFKAEGMLGFLGYSVGLSSRLTSEQRQVILRYVVFGTLPKVNDLKYTKEWGEPRSSKRITKLKNSLRSFSKNAERRTSNMDQAIDDWRKDYHYVEQVLEPMAMSGGL